ncbi:hypothetical protein QEJ31_14500 [Pigmentibacter sp. JX0631]|uniref:hypothetical protein n=1 Tax=Pigmentibacter sp. JX0631 TaxID=2976982 RepID=UPI0024682F30|nr:hypothetical protein [Pigmentibacter sp. JX0631]WGL59740.1 hypothetical protein QEJ31_14500 [Pigmentibacter sp. JX0631]
MKIKTFAILFLILFFNTAVSANPIKSQTSNYNYINYIKWLDRLNTVASGANFIAKKYNPLWHLDSLGFYQSGYAILKDSYLINAGKGEFDLKTATGSIIKAMQIHGYLTGYVLPGLSQISFMYTAYSTYPSVLNAFYHFTHTPLNILTVDAKNPILKISDFGNTNEPSFSNSTYLRCSILSADKVPKLENSEFITEEDLPRLEKEIPNQYYKGHIIVYGRWLEITSNDSVKKQYVFATLNSPIELQEACLRKYQPYLENIFNSYKADPTNKFLEKLYFDHLYLFQNGENSSKYFIPTAGNTSYSDHYPILFYTQIDKENAIRLAP